MKDYIGRRGNSLDFSNAAKENNSWRLQITENEIENSIQATNFPPLTLFCFLLVTIPQSSDFWRHFNLECILSCCVSQCQRCDNILKVTAVSNPHTTCSCHTLTQKEPPLEVAKCPPRQRLSCLLGFCWSKQVCEHRAYFSHNVVVRFSFPRG